MRLACGLIIPIVLLTAPPAFADDEEGGDSRVFFPSRPVFSVVGSLEGTYTDNAFFAPSDRRDDVYFEPDISLRLDGVLVGDIYYRVYVRTAGSAFSDETDANLSDTRIGGRLSRDIFDWTASLIYENRYFFEGIFGEHLFTAHDVKGAASRDFDCGPVIFTPSGVFTYRFSDVDEAQRYRLELWLGIEVPLDTKWSIVSAPFFEQFWFTDGLNKDRSDQIYSASLGLKYNLSDNATLTTEVIYEGRRSNQEGRHADMLEIGPRLDFAF